MRSKPYLAPPFRPRQATGDSAAVTLDVPGYRQVRNYTCGYACALMVLHYFGGDVSGQDLYARLGTSRDGTRQTALIRELRAAGVGIGVRYDFGFERLRTAIDRNKLVLAYHYPIEHWVVLYGYDLNPARVYVADSRQHEPNLHAWQDYGPTLRDFGIVCSAPRATLATATQRPAQLTFAF